MTHVTIMTLRHIVSETQTDRQTDRQAKFIFRYKYIYIYTRNSARYARRFLVTAQVLPLCLPPGFSRLSQISSTLLVLLDVFT